MCFHTRSPVFAFLDVYLFCADGLKGSVETISAVYPHNQVQRCIVYQIRSPIRFVSYKDIGPLMDDLKKAYTTVTEDEALENLVMFKEKWGKVYLSCVKSWEGNWDMVLPQLQLMFQDRQTA